MNDGVWQIHENYVNQKIWGNRKERVQKELGKKGRTDYVH